MIHFNQKQRKEGEYPFYPEQPLGHFDGNKYRENLPVTLQMVADEDNNQYILQPNFTRNVEDR